MYSHPLDYNIVEDITYRYDHFAKSIESDVVWSSKMSCDYVPQGILFLIIDHSIGQFNKTPHPIGVTIYLTVNYIKDVTVSDKLSIKININSVSLSKKGKQKTVLLAECFDSDNNKVADGEALFILDKEIISTSESLSEPVCGISKIISVKNHAKLFKHSRYYDMFCKNLDNEMLFLDGYGPPESVHGGLIGLGITSFLPKLKMLKVVYKRLTPFKVLLNLYIDDRTGTFALIHKEKETHQCNGMFEIA